MLKIFKGKESKPTAPVAVPKHIAFICDGNRRWAEARGLPPLMGHKAGIANFENLADWYIAHAFYSSLIPYRTSPSNNRLLLLNGSNFQ